MLMQLNSFWQGCQTVIPMIEYMARDSAQLYTPHMLQILAVDSVNLCTMTFQNSEEKVWA